MSKRRALLAAGAALTLAGCGSAADLKSRWVDLPSPVASPSYRGVGLADILEEDAASMTVRFADVTFLQGFDPEVFPERSYASVDTPEGGYVAEFSGGRAVVDIGPEATADGVARLELNMSGESILYADADADGYLDRLVVVDQQVSFYRSAEEREAGMMYATRPSTGFLLSLYGGETFYLMSTPEQVSDLSVIDGGFSYTVTTGDVLDTHEIGAPHGYPQRIDQYGGAISCSTDIGEIEAALDGEPHTAKELSAYPGAPSFEGFDEHTYFEMPAGDEDANPMVFNGYTRVVFLLEGGDMGRWTDYRCGWTE